MTAEEIWTEYAAFYGHDSVEAFQRFFGLMATGILDTGTVQAITQPRCGLRDNLVVIAEAKWRKRDLGWYVDKYLDGLDRAAQDNIFDAAWKSWGAVCDLRFQKVGSMAQADILLSTGSGRQDGFDGPSGVLAWMTLGTNADNQILGRFDMGETWVNDPARDIYLLAVAAHEFGHALNLDHASQNSGALMAPYYKRSIFKPTAHDIARVQALYGPPTGAPPTPGTPGTPPIPPLSPTGGIMREIVTLVVAAVLGYFKQSFPFLGRFLTDAMQEKIVDFIMRRFGLANVQLVQGSAPVTLASMDIDSVSRELTAEIGPPPTA